MANRNGSQTNVSNGVLVEETLPEQEPLNKHSYDVDSTTKVPPTDETRRAKYERRLKEKTGLSRRGLIVAICVLFLLFVCLIVVISLAACWPTTPHAWSYPICRTTACLETSVKMLGMMNETVDPCRDFWGYSCGAWVKRHRTLAPERSQWGASELEDFTNAERIRSLITTLPHTNDIASIGWKIKHIYESCMSMENIETDKERPLKKVISDLGEWAVLREFSVLSWNFKRALERLHSQHGVTPFFKVTVVPDSRFPFDATHPPVIQISPAGLGFPDRSYYYRHPESPLIAAYQRYLKDAVQALGATSVDAGKFSVDMFNFEKRIAEITPTADELNDPIRAYNPKTLSELKIIAPSIPLHEILVAKFPKANIDGSTKIIVTSPSYLGNISLIISTTDRSGLNNYLMWQLTEAYLPYLSQEFQDIVNYYRKETTGASRGVSRWEFCVSTTRRFMGFALAGLQERSVEEKTREKAADTVSTMFQTIVTSVERAIKAAAHLEEDIKDQAMDKIISLGLQVGYPPDMLTNSYLNTFYAPLHVQRSDLFTNVGYGLDFLQGHASRQLTGQSHDSWWDKMADSSSVFYVAADHRVFVPMWMILQAHQSPSALYGSLGVSLSRAIIASVTPTDVLYKPRGVLLLDEDRAVNQSERSVRNAKKCLVRDALRWNLTANHVTNKTSLDAVAQVSAVRHAQKALQASNFPHVHQPAMETLDSDALFYVSYAQTLCSVSTPEQDDLDFTVNTRVKGLAMLQASLRQLPHFSETFSCTADSPFVSQPPCNEIL